MCGAFVNWTPPIPYDNCTIDSTRSNFNSGDEFPVGITRIEYITYDASFNTDTARFIIVIRDQELPTIDCPDNISTCDPFVFFTEPIGSDNCVNPLTVRTDGLSYSSGDKFPVGISTLSYRVTDLAKNSLACSFEIEIYAPTIADAGVDLSTTDILPIQIQGDATNASSINWNEFMSLSDNTIAKPIANPQKSTTYVMQVVSPNGCTDSDSVFIDVKVVQELGANNLFTPNGDGKNETWEVNKVALIQGCRLVIFNRNGTQVYETRNYNNTWDGTVSGKQLPEGSYYYIIDCDDGRTYNGPITILRLNK